MTKESILELEKKWADLLKGPKRLKNSETNNKSITAVEMQTQLKEDTAYQKWFKESEEIRIALEAAYRREYQSLTDELKAIDVHIESIWDLVNLKSSYNKAAVPILIRHLSEPYHIKNKEGIVRALAVKEAKGDACQAIIDEYHKAPRDKSDYRWAFGNTMAEIITKEYIDQVSRIVLDKTNGESRHMFVRALGKIKSPKAKETLLRVSKDEDELISKEAGKALGKMKTI